MSNNKNQIIIYYGDREVCYGPSSVDLSSFSLITIEHPNPDIATIRDLIRWFVQIFQLDPNIYSVKVRCLVIRSLDPLIWELKPAYRTYQ